MKEVKPYKTKDDFARSFVPAYKQALKLAKRKARGEKLENNADEWINGLISEAGEIEKKSGVNKNAD